ncbi:MarR family winged helix-turn-helix transcriptional regulator [Polycladomyces subterraneus]|uniref:MarR family transcriptional regulator n=1 Tax=Polycladomyces subterraneus TaxID=1016997 RepID=A0ABT8IJD4_9BACL|nr:MarR family transcriptional regulator [Polycladomyces subterraneus]MDN4592893.1 MarR family transcriptional regulator [Polycladomyces subterraneus]
MSTRQELLHELEISLRTLIRKLRKELQAVLGETISNGDFFILKQLQERGPQTVSELAQELEVSASHITNVTDRLVNKGWVERQRSRRDKRVVELRITNEGETIIRELGEKKRAYFQRRFDCLTTEEIETLTRLFQKLI